MTILHDLQNVSAFALLTVCVGVLPMMIAGLYAARPSERWLALMRPVSLAAIFAALASLMSGVMIILRGIAATPGLAIGPTPLIARGAAESIAPLFVIFACLTVAWLLVAVGMRRAAGTTEHP